MRTDGRSCVFQRLTAATYSLDPESVSYMLGEFSPAHRRASVLTHMAGGHVSSVRALIRNPLKTRDCDETAPSTRVSISRNTVYHSGYFCVNTYSHLGRMLKIHEYYSCTLYSLYTSNNQRYTRKYSCITRVYLEVLVYLRKGRAAAAPRRGLQIGVELIASASSPPLSLQKIFAISVQCCSLVFG